jgi:hypothetical protein
MPRRRDVEAATPKCPKCSGMMTWRHVFDFWECFRHSPQRVLVYAAAASRAIRGE